MSESRFPDTFTAVWSTATDSEQRDGVLRRWATLVPVRDPKYGVADLAVEFDGLRACYLRPPHLGRIAALIEQENVESLEVPALIERGPAGPTVTLLIADEGRERIAQHLRLASRTPRPRCRSARTPRSPQSRRHALVP